MRQIEHDIGAIAVLPGRWSESGLHDQRRHVTIRADGAASRSGVTDPWGDGNKSLTATSDGISTTIGPDIHNPRGAKPHVRYLHPYRLARDLHVLVAPGELIRLARLEQQRNKRGHIAAQILAATIRSAPGVAPHRVIRSLKTFAQQQIVDPCHPAAGHAGAAPHSRSTAIETLLKRPDPESAG